MAQQIEPALSDTQFQYLSITCGNVEKTWSIHNLLNSSLVKKVRLKVLTWTGSCVGVATTGGGRASSGGGDGDGDGSEIAGPCSCCSCCSERNLIFCRPIRGKYHYY